MKNDIETKLISFFLRNTVEMETHSIILAWRISWEKEPNRVQSIRSQRVRHD